MVKIRDVGFVKRFVIPIFAIAGSIFMIFSCIWAHGMANVWFLLLTAVVMVIGAFFCKEKKD